jgi:hypothetical protein
MRLASITPQSKEGGAMLYGIIFAGVFWVSFLTATVYRVERQNRKIIDLLEDIRMKTIDADWKKE